MVASAGENGPASRHKADCALLAAAGISSADAPLTEISQLRLERSEEGVFLSTNVRFELPAVVEDALDKGIPMFFVAEAVLFRDRWYWYDRQVTSSARHMRLSYQPLTATWRVGLGALSQSYASLGEALSVVSSVGRWKLAEAAALDPDESYYLDFSYQLDTAQLPRPMQIGLGGDWSLGFERTLAVD